MPIEPIIFKENYYSEDGWEVVNSTAKTEVNSNSEGTPSEEFVEISLEASGEKKPSVTGEEAPKLEIALAIKNGQSDKREPSPKLVAPNKDPLCADCCCSIQ